MYICLHCMYAADEVGSDMFPGTSVTDSNELLKKAWGTEVQSAYSSGTYKKGS